VAPPGAAFGLAGLIVVRGIESELLERGGTTMGVGFCAAGLCVGGADWLYCGFSMTEALGGGAGGGVSLTRSGRGFFDSAAGV